MKKQTVLAALLMVLPVATEAGAQAGDPGVRDTMWRGRVTTHMAQEHRGVRVRGASLTVHASGRVVDTRLAAERLLAIDTSPSVPAQAAAKTIRGLVAGSIARSTEPALVIAHDRLLWEGYVTTSFPMGAWRVSIDAHTGAVHERVSLARHARGNAYPKHPVAGEPVEVELTDLMPGAVGLHGELAIVRSLFFDEEGKASAVSHATADDAGDYLYEPDHESPIDGFSEVNAYYHVTQVSHWFTDHFGHAPVVAADVITNYREGPGQDYLNAFAYRDPTSGRFHLTMGQAGAIDMAYDGLTLAHEYGHPIFDEKTTINEDNVYPINADARGLHPAPHAMNEGFSDYWAATIYDDPDMFAATGDNELSPRHLVNDNRCPESIWGEAHLDAPLVSGTLWEMRGIIGPALSDEIAFNVLSRLTGSPTFEELGGLLSDMVHALEADGDVTKEQSGAVDAMLERRGLFNCTRTVRLADGVARTSQMPGAWTFAGALGLKKSLCGTLQYAEVRIPLAMSYELTAPTREEGGDDVEALTLDVSMERADGEAWGADELDYVVVVRKDLPAELEILELPFGGQIFALPIAAQVFDHFFDEEPTAIRIPVADLPYEPGATYHINILAMNCPTARHTTTARWVRPPKPEPGPEAAPEPAPDVLTAPEATTTDAGPIGTDVGATTSGASDDGCAAGGPRFDGWLALLLVLALWRLRRRLGRTVGALP